MARLTLILACVCSFILLQQAGPWTDCVKPLAHHDGNRFKYELDAAHPEYETPCIPFNSALERARMEDYVKRNWSAPDCSYHPAGFEQGCHNTYHFDDVAIQSDGYDRNDLGTNAFVVVVVFFVLFVVLFFFVFLFSFAIRDKKEALLLLTHFVGVLHQPLDDIPFDIGLKATRELMASACAVPADTAPIDGWAAAWASDTVLVAHDAFDSVALVAQPLLAGRNSDLPSYLLRRI